MRTMFTLPHNTITYLYKEAIDMRLGMFRLQGVIAQQLNQPTAERCFFLFINKAHTLLKTAWFDGTSLCLFGKRLEQGQLSWPQPATVSDEKMGANPTFCSHSATGWNRAEKLHKKADK